jgi:glutamyl-tRNA synthetase
MHLGLAQTALAAWLDARAQGGRIVLRMEDVDTGRVVPGSEASLVEDLTWLGLDFDGPIVRQTARSDAYAAALEQLAREGRVFSCTCSRREIREASAPHGPSDEGPRYPGTCREGARPKPGRRPALRFRTAPGDVVRHWDRRLGHLDQDVHSEVGDFVLRRSDGLWAYQLAVTVDDLAQGVTCVVRGEDLARSTARQLVLRRTLDPEAPALDTLHVPLVLGPDGRRLAKRDGSASVGEARAAGVSPERVVGRLAAALGLLERPEPVRAEELIPAWRRRYTG